ncbi:MAG: efflux RND transporter periplasmic adaptor subunit [Verrucomicrobiae bacterium]|nr:efflux RND transporter periplasmic adaptor subunit [Verrucomicrobiae bacterium]NNJ86165.1 efflux RND transporter periplasmic adaptor subunit [Akkermansiaceae bacterium]
MKLILKILIPFVFIGLAVFIVGIMIKSKKEKPARKPVMVVPHAEFINVAIEDHYPPVVSYGTVQSYFETMLTPQVSGQIVEVSPGFRVGKLVKKDTVLARIDDTNYVAALAQQKANLIIAQRTLAEEKIQAKQAAGDWVASGRDLATASDFVLRKPQLAAAEATIESTRAAIKKAEVDIERTVIRAPYDAVVLERDAAVGNYASQQQSLGRLVATDKVEVRLPLTAVQTARVHLPGVSAKNDPRPTQVTLSSAAKPDVQWNGALTRTEPAVDPKNQVTYVIAEVLDPYLADPAPLVVGTFVNVSIPAKTITDACMVPESALVNDSYVWVIGSSNLLSRIPSERVYSHDGSVYLRLSTKELEINKIKSPIRIVTRPLANFRTGEKVKPVAAD